MTRKTKINRRTRNAIRTYVKQGLSGNKIQKRLSKRGLGIRRKTLLAEIRKVKRQRPRVPREKYVPHKYRPLRIPAIAIVPKMIRLEGRFQGERKTVRERGSGKDLFRFVRKEMDKADRGEGWDARPKVIS